MKRIIPLLLLLALSLVGCSLAKEDAATSGEDRLVGFLISRESLDLFDAEAFLEDNLHKLHGGSVVLDGDTSAYQGRIYAEPVEEEVTDDHGDVYRQFSYRFDIPDTFYAYYACYPLLEDSLDYLANPSGGEFTELNFTCTDTELEVTGSATVTPDADFEVLHMNPVFQQPDGLVYVAEGNAARCDMNREGEQWTMTNDQTLTTTIDGVSTELTSKVAFTLFVERPAKSITVRETAADGEALRAHHFLPGQLPETLELLPETAYLIVESGKTDDSGQPIVERELVERSAGMLGTTFADENGICRRQFTSFSAQ